MNTERYTAKDLEKLLRKQKIATMDELKRALETDVAVTVVRKLKLLRYRTSYSHRGRYYTLEDIPRFNDLGLWSYQSICFSRFGTLLSTAEAFVDLSDAGYYASELESVFEVAVDNALLRLFKQGRIVREKLAGQYLYCSADSQNRKRQISFRRFQQSEPRLGRLPEDLVPEELKAAIVLFFSLLDEQQQRLYSGLESMKWGYGGDRKVAEILGVDVGTVAKGRRQLLGQKVDAERVRKAGGGRKPMEKKLRKSSKKSDS